MDHTYIQENQIVDRYLMGTLPPEEMDEFADHSMSCQQCLDELEVGERMQGALRRVLTQDQQDSSVAKKHRPASVRILFASAALLILAMFVSLVAKLVGLQTEVKRLQQPKTNLVTLRLSPVRSSLGPPIARIPAPQNMDTMVIFQLEVEPSAQQVFSAVLWQKEDQLWQQTGLLPNDQEEVVIGIPTHFLTPADYRIELQGPSKEQLTSFSFSVVPNNNGNQSPTVQD